ncbi:MAG TPA: rubrerythrin family protein [Armatimonadota bacterium]|jgi:rubrerythrin
MTTTHKSLQGTQTEKNILTAFAGESQARNRYTFFASKAKEEGYAQIADAFEETANQEKEHAKRLFKLLEGGVVEISAAFPAGSIGATAQNLQGSAHGEKEEFEGMYPEFAVTARAEGFESIARIMESIAVAEKFHAKRFLGLLANIENGTVFAKAAPVVWRCRNCGYTHEGADAPKACPACAHPQAYFEVAPANW